MRAQVAMRLLVAGCVSAVSWGTTGGIVVGQTFRARTDTVTVSVSVTRGNVAVTGLGADDFELLDNGVAQVVEAVTVEGVPVDVTVVYDTSPGQAGRLERLKADIRHIAAVLRPTDLLRLLIFGDNRQVVDVFGWQPASAELGLEAITAVRISPVNDALLISLIHRPGVGRRHLVVALTDGRDAGSAVSASQIRDVAERAESVLHLVMMTNASVSPSGGAGYFLPVGVERNGPELLREVAELTGGRVHDRFLGSPDPVKALKAIFDAFRASYVLRYTPAGVALAGWHDIQVQVPGQPTATVRARRGYSGRVEQWRHER